MADAHRARLEEGVKHMLSDVTESATWTPLVEEKGVKVVYKETKGMPDRFVATAIVNAPIQKIFETTYNFDQRLKWDTNMNTESHVLETLADDLSITYQQVNGRMGVSGREFVNARLKKDLPGGAILVVHNNIEHSYKNATNPVRGKHFDTGYIITPIDEHSCRLNWIIQTEIGGWIGFLNIRSITGQQLVILLNNLRATVGAGAH